MNKTLATLVLTIALLQSARAQGPGGFGGPDQSLVSMFDTNGDGRLDAAERKAAREWLDRQRPAFGGFGGRGGGPPGGFGGRGGFAQASAGRKLAPADVRAYPATTPLYSTEALRTFFIQF